MVGTVMAVAQVGMAAVQMMNERNNQRDLIIKQNALKKEAFSYLDQLSNPWAAFQVSDAKEQLAMDQQAQNVANLSEVVGQSGVGALGQVSNILRAQDKTNLEMMAGLDEKEMMAQKKRLQGEQDLQEMQLGGKYDFTLEELKGTGEAFKESKMIQRQAGADLISGLGSVASNIESDMSAYRGTAGAKLGQETKKLGQEEAKLNKRETKLGDINQTDKPKKYGRVEDRIEKSKKGIEQRKTEIKRLEEYIEEYGLGAKGF